MFLKTCFTVYQSPARVSKAKFGSIFSDIEWVFYTLKCIATQSMHVVVHESVNEILNLINLTFSLSVLVILQLWKDRQTWIFFYKLIFSQE